MYNLLLLALTHRLPPLNNVYKGSFYIPFIGNQNIEFERLKVNTSQVRLHGLINCNGYIYNNAINDNINDNNINNINDNINDNINNINNAINKPKDETAMNYELDNLLKSIIHKYTCTIEAPYYNACNDTILFVLKIKLLGLIKTIKLFNTK
jgi:hypothetical protein